MMHQLSTRFRREFSGSTEAVRVGIANEDDSMAPVLLIKGTSLSLKYLIRLRTFRLSAWRLPPVQHLCYSIEIQDDLMHPATLWSVAEGEEELLALAEIALRKAVPLFLFNEENLNVASTTVKLNFYGDSFDNVLAGTTVAPEGSWKDYQHSLSSLLKPGSTVSRAFATPSALCEWEEVHSTLITTGLTHCSIAAITGEEGDQQEALAEWFIDALGHPTAVRNPMVQEEGGVRELSDLLLNHECRADVPRRQALKRAVVKAIKKAVKQLTGACAKIRRGLRMSDSADREIVVTRDQPIHCIVLVPDLSLIADQPAG
jgi:hypothetical protein